MNKHIEWESLLEISKEHKSLSDPDFLGVISLLGKKDLTLDEICVEFEKKFFILPSRRKIRTVIKIMLFRKLIYEIKTKDEIKYHLDYLNQVIPTPISKTQGILSIIFGLVFLAFPNPITFTFEGGILLTLLVQYILYDYRRKKLALYSSNSTYINLIHELINDNS